ncbi:MAG TPA: hypothetical protein VJ784_07980 [Pyrinomonadaceae bacterium]|jgi:hypothetical protein|nr:hypothetical protein [Pyrinomonadaceae bacterium]
MAQVFLITEHKDLANSVERYLHSKERIGVVATTSPRQLVGTGHESRAHWVPHTFSKLADWLETSGEQASATKFGLFNSICLIEVPNLNALGGLDPIDRTRDWSAVVGMLILAFPEILWGLITQYEPRDEAIRNLHFLKPANFCERLDELIELQKEGFSPLFDPSGFRNKLRSQMAQRPQADYLPLRKERAVTIDEEENYAYFNAYVAYRFGFRSNVVTSYQMMTNLLGDDNQNPFLVSFEDIYLNFADRRRSMSRLDQRDNKCPALRDVSNRIFITSGHSRTPSERDTMTRNEAYLEKFAKNKRYYIKTLFKPGSGVFDLWKKSGLHDRFVLNDGRANGFDWPPPAISETEKTEGTHSAPGRLLVIAERLIKRASQVRRNVDSVTQAIYGATLALEAQEYLGHRTPTTSLDAIALKHQLEVLAESMFNGIEYNLDTSSRFAEIEEEMDCVGSWFREETREVSELNAEIGLISDLVLTFRNHNQFSEEQAGLTKLRDLNRRLWVRRNSPLGWIVCPLRYYVDTLLASIRNFVVAITAWLLIFGLAYAWSAHQRLADGGDTNQRSATVDAGPSIMHGMEDAISAFFGMQPPNDFGAVQQAGEPWVWVTLFIILVGFIHLGIFVSHLYSIMSRR